MALRLRRLFPSMLSRFPNMIQYRTVLNFTGCSLPYSASSKGGGYYGKLIQFGLRTVRDSYVSPVGGCGHRIFVHFPAKLGAGNNLGFHLQPREIVQRRLFSSKVGTYPHFEEGSSGVVGTQKSGSLKKKRRYGARKKDGADRGRSVIQNAVSAEPKVISQESKKGGEIIFQMGKEVADKGASEKNQHVAALVDCFTGAKPLTGYNVLSSTVKIRKSDPSWRLRSAAARKRGAAKIRKLTIRNVDSKKGGEIIFQTAKEVADKGASEKTQHVTALVDCFTGAKPLTGDSFLSSTVKKQKSNPSWRLRLVAACKRGAAKMRKLTLRNVDSTDPKGRGGQEFKSGCVVVCGSGGTRLAMSKGKNAQTTKASFEQFVEAQPDIRKMDSAHLKKHEGREVKSGDQLGKIKNKKTRPAKRSIKKKRLSTGKEVEGKPSSGTTSSVTAEIEDSTTASRSSGPCTTSASSVKVKTNRKRLKARGKALVSHKMDAAITSKSVSKNIKVQKDENRGEIISHSGKMATTESKDMKSQIAKDSDIRNQSLKSKKQKKKNLRKSMSLVTAETKGSGTASQAKKPHTSNALLQRNEIRRPVLPVEGGTKDMKKKLMPLYPPLGKSVVVVESLTKAQLIQGYLGDMFEVLPSYGHVRDLAARSGSVRPDDDFSMVWEVPSSAWTPLKSIMVALNGAENLILASDPDREGEAIAWHITEMLRHQDSLLDNITVARVVFHEITETSIKNALMNPRDIDANLVNAHLARRALEYLIGFKISPLLWQKLPGCQMAGRVQSVALALVCEKEMEIDRFKPEEYWTVNVEFQKDAVSSIKENPFSSKLMHLNPKKLEKLSIGSSAEAEAVKQRISLSEFRVIDTCTNQSKSCPPLPYTTSTLQQDAGSRLHFTVAQTMSLAQKLYEGVKLSENEATGLITYMRTDKPHVSKEAAHDILSLVSERYGMQYALKCPRTDFQKVTNSQESYEAIRPTNIRRLPSMLVGVLDNDCLKLYTLIWSRTMASQMESSITDMVQVDIGNLAGDIVFQSTSSKIGFLGHQAVSKDEETALIAADFSEGDSCEEAYSVLPSLRVNDQVYLGKVELMQHSTEPPVRYSEGSLVKKLEELGIGRPSTYASVIKVLQDRNYLAVKNKLLFPEFRARMVSAFLSTHFSDLADCSFTADTETELDNVSFGVTEWKALLKDYWSKFNKHCDRARNIRVQEVERMLEKTLGDAIFSSFPDKGRTCPSCSEGTLRFKISKSGAGYFIGCSKHPLCRYVAGNVLSDDEEVIDKPATAFQPRLIGLHPGSDEKIYLKQGPYGYYVQLGEDKKGHTPKRAPITQIKDVESISVEDAVGLLRFPITLGNHPEDGHPVMIKLSAFRYSVRHRSTIAPVPKNVNPHEITLKAALKLLKSKYAKHSGRPKKKKNS